MKIEKVNSKEYKLLEDELENVFNEAILVKKGIIFDGASIPKIFWNVVGSPFTGNYTVPALFHDALYMAELFDRKKCDKIFLELMRMYGVSYFKRYAMYYAVRVGGYFVWKKHDVAKVEENKKYVKVIA